MSIKLEGPIMIMPVDDDELPAEANTTYQLLWFLATIAAIFGALVKSA